MHYLPFRKKLFKMFSIFYSIVVFDVFYFMIGIRIFSNIFDVHINIITCKYIE